MKALTLYQPWASLVALGVKTIETRSWSTSYRGPLVIHAGLRCEDLFTAGGWWVGGGPKLRRGTPRFLWGPIDGAPCDVQERCIGHAPIAHVRPLPLGAVVATCTLVDVVPMWAPNLVERPDLGGLLVGTTTDRSRLLLWRGGDPEVRQPRDVTDQRPYGDFSPGRWAWLLSDVKPLAEPVPARGKQGLWEWTP